VPAADIKTPINTPIYLQTLLSYAIPVDGKERLLLETCNRVRTQLNNLPKDANRIEEFPAVAALAYAIHSLLGFKPWERSTEAPKKPIDLHGSWNDGDDGWFERDEPILD